MRKLMQDLEPRAQRVFKEVDRRFEAGLRYTRKHWRKQLPIAAGGVFVVLGLFLLWAATLELPDLASLETRRIEQSVKIYDRTGSVLLYDLHDKAQRTIVPLPNISPLIQQAILAIEDPEFYTHKGIKPTAIARAIFTNLTEGELLSGQGGSTITQQVVKLTVLTNDKTLTRKLKEWVLALKMERALTKDQILELYLNHVPFGGQLYGVEEAAMTFFGKHAADVSLEEAAYLAAVLPAPTRLSPYGTHLDQLETRKNLVLEKMEEHGYITAEELAQAKQTHVVFVPPRDKSIAAPHFVFYIRQYLEDKYGEDALQQGGWRVITTLDADLQEKAEGIVLRNALDNVEKFNASNMSLVAIDPNNGHILVMVGSRNYFDTEIPGAYNVAVSDPGRQPGSAFKPFAYAQAFSEGYTPETVLFDVRTQFSTTCGIFDMSTGDGCYSPVNYDNKFRGPMSMREALAQSINVPSVKTLYLAGLTDTLRLAKALGVTTLGDPNRYGLTLVLGGGEVTLLDMTGAYGAFANDGIHFPPNAVIKIEDAKGNVIEDNTQLTGNQVLEPYVAQEISDVLSDPVARAPLGENNLFNFPGADVAVKTGTTNDYRDAWTIGYTPNIVVGVWAGNNDNSSMVKRVSGFIVGPAWSEFMRYALTRVPAESFTRAEVPPAPKAVLNGVWQTPGEDGAIHEILYWVDKNNPRGPRPSNPSADPQFERWDAPVRAWANQYGVQAVPSSSPTQEPTQPMAPVFQGGAVIPH